MWACPFTYSDTECFTVSWFGKPQICAVLISVDFGTGAGVLDHESL